MGKREEIRNIIIVLIIAISIVLILNYGFRVDSTVLGVISGILTLMIPSTLSYLKADKTNKIVLEFVENQTEINEFIRHRKEIDNVCQTIEKNTCDIFGKYAEIKPILADYIIEINENISSLIDKKYGYNLDLFDPDYFRKQLIIKINKVSKNAMFVMFDKDIFQKINEKVIFNIDIYIEKLGNLTDINNGKRRSKFKRETIKLANNIANHSINIYRDYKKSA